MAHATEYAEHRNRLRRPSFDWCKEPTEAFLALTSSSASTKPLLRIRTPANKTFGETFGEARAATVESVITCHTGQLRGQRPQLQKKKKPCPQATDPRPSQCRRPRQHLLIFSHAEARRARRKEDGIFSACSAAPREPLPRVCLLKRRSVRRSARRPGSATHGYKRSEYETITQVRLLPDEG